MWDSSARYSTGGIATSAAANSATSTPTTGSTIQITTTIATAEIPATITFDRNSQEVHVEPLDTVDEHGLELAAALTRHPGGPEPEDPVDQPTPQVRRDPDRCAGHHALLDRRADGPEADQGDREDQRRHDLGHRGAVEDAADRDRQRDPRGDPSGGDAEAERHRSGEGAPLGRGQPHQPPVERARGPVGSRHGGTLASDAVGSDQGGDDLSPLRDNTACTPKTPLTAMTTQLRK